MTEKTIWRLPEVMARTGLPRTTIYSKISVGEFPPSINLSGRSVGWIADEVEAWIQSRVDASRSAVQADNLRLSDWVARGEEGSS